MVRNIEDILNTQPQVDWESWMHRHLRGIHPYLWPLLLWWPPHRITIFEETGGKVPSSSAFTLKILEGHLTLSSGVCEELCPAHVIRDVSFSIQVFTILVQVNRFFVVVPKPATSPCALHSMVGTAGSWAQLFHPVEPRLVPLCHSLWTALGREIATKKVRVWARTRHVLHSCLYLLSS